ncbi:hypothetical protein HYU10_02835 [Candidatus Woesearchaeota archaeon]|nr:hypothetical protein [Candidatus Woesearchaeota archaeon]MBI2130682.1 hypothetical protein [Candidatus Woesearchaeota archaeon]MBI2660877.1 hypothetical protein [Candidatus Woesearchaeota archaeon]
MLDRRLIEIEQVKPRYYAEMKRAMRGHAEAILETVDSGSGLEELVGQDAISPRTRNGYRMWAERASQLRVEEDSAIGRRGWKPSPTKAYARIMQVPPSYHRYKFFSQVIDDFLKEEDARKLSVQLQPGKWERAAVKDFNIDGLDPYERYTRIQRYERLASENGMVTLGFRFPHREGEEVDYEITFMRYGGEITVSNISIPFNARDNFAWRGSDQGYYWINAIWSPVELSPIATLRSSLWNGYDFFAHVLHKRHAA